MNVVQQNTQEIETLCHGKGIETTFVLNSGAEAAVRVVEHIVSAATAHRIHFIFILSIQMG